MAGTILIDRDSGVALNSIGYRQFVEAVRAHLDPEAVRATESVFEPNDLECMSFISLVEADEATFQCFHSAANSAYAEAINRGQAFPEWAKVMERLKRDPRSNSTD